MRLPSQSSLFWQSHCTLAASNHSRMAAMQRAAEQEDLARDSKKVAAERQAMGEKAISLDAFDPRYRKGAMVRGN